MKTKGFTLLEVTIVFVVIGILLGMALKARGVVELARIKREGALLIEMNDAYMRYVALNGQDYAKRPGLTLNMSHFDEFMPPSKRYSEMMKDSWHYSWCRLDTNTPLPAVGYFEPHADGQYICTNMNTKLPAEVACYVDYMIDDSIWNRGSGRVHNSDGAVLYEGDLSGMCHKLHTVQANTNPLHYMWLNKNIM